MDLKKRIESIGVYFSTFNVNDGIIYILVNFPSNWIIEGVVANEDVTIAPTNDGFYFYGNLEIGTDAIFDAIETVIAYNKEIEKKKLLLAEKIKELEALFIAEPVERLEKLTFIFDKKPKKPRVEVKQDETAEPVKNNEENNVSEENDVV